MTVHFVKYAGVSISTAKVTIANLRTSCGLLLSNLRFSELSASSIGVSCTACKESSTYDLDILNRSSL